MADLARVVGPPGSPLQPNGERRDEAASRSTSSALLELLESEGIDRLFGNPGTTELPLMAALEASSGVDFVLGLQEATVVAMADGYARATRRPSAVLLHVVAGVANGLIGLHNARASRTPIVAIAGQQDQRHLDQQPMLSGDVVGVARAVCKEAVEVYQPYDIAPVVRRAFRTAQAPPAGPVLVSIPMDLLDEPYEGSLPARSPISQAGPSAGSAEAARVLARAARPAIVAGNVVANEGALEDLVSIAELLGATVYHQPLFDAISFPLDHRLYAGMLPTNNAGIAELLGRHDVVFIVGAHAFAPHGYTVRSAVPAHVEIVQLSSDAAQVARNYPVKLGLVGSVRETLEAMARELEAEGVAPKEPRATDVPELPLAGPEGDREQDRGDRDPRAAAKELAEAIPADAIVVEEAITTGIEFRRHLRLRGSDQYHHTIGGGLGWGIGAAIGVKLGSPARPVIAVLGDGSALYSVQALWTAAREKAATVFVILNNRQYRAVGVDITEPAVDFVTLAASFGVHGEAVEPRVALAPALEAAIERAEPVLLEVPIRGA
jgi:benzoylformate decarboxylase